MAIKITSTKHVTTTANCLNYGASGVGKTSLIATAPEPIILSAESGLMSLADLDLPVIEIKSLKDVADAFLFFRDSDDAKMYETINIDSLSELGEVLLAEYKQEENDARRAYARMADHMAALIRNFRDLPGYNTYFTAKQLRLVDETSGRISYCPSLPGKSLTINLSYFFDIVTCMRIGTDDEGANFRYLQTQPDRQYEAKDRSGKLNPIEEPHLGRLFDKIKAKPQTEKGE